MNSFIAGFGIGCALGILFAPISGKEVRDTITEKASDIVDTARRRYRDVRERASETISALRDDMGGAELCG